MMEMVIFLKQKPVGASRPYRACRTASVVLSRQFHQVGADLIKDSQTSLGSGITRRLFLAKCNVLLGVYQRRWFQRNVG